MLPQSNNIRTWRTKTGGGGLRPPPFVAQFLVLHVLLALQQHDLRVLFALRELLLQGLLHVLRYCGLNLLQLLLGLRGSLLQFSGPRHVPD